MQCHRITSFNILAFWKTRPDTWLNFIIRVRQATCSISVPIVYATPIISKPPTGLNAHRVLTLSLQMRKEINSWDIHGHIHVHVHVKILHFLVSNESYTHVHFIDVRVIFKCYLVDDSTCKSSYLCVWLCGPRWIVRLEPNKCWKL